MSDSFHVYRFMFMVGLQFAVYGLGLFGVNGL